MSNPFTTTALLWTLPEIREMMNSAQEHFQEYVAEQDGVERLKSAIVDFRQISDVLKMADASSASVLSWELADVLELIYNAPQPPSHDVLEKLIEGSLQLSNVLHYLSGGHDEPTDLLVPLINDLRAQRHARPYQPSNVQPSPEIAKAFMTGRNQDVWSSVAGAIKEDLGGVKDNIDLFLRTGQSQLLLAQMPELERTALVFSFLEIPSLRDRINQQLGILSGIVSSLSGRELGDHEKNQLLDVASDLLLIDNDLDNHVSLLLYNKEVDLNPEINDTLTKEIFINLARAKHLITEFDEKKLSTDVLNEVVKLFHEVSGALMILNMYDVLPVLDHVEEYLQKEVIDKSRHPDRVHLQAFASSIVCVECFIEAIRDRNPYTSTILQYASGYLAELGIAWDAPGSSETLESSTEDQAISASPVFEETVVASELSREEIVPPAPVFDSLPLPTETVPPPPVFELTQELIDALGSEEPLEQSSTSSQQETKEEKVTWGEEEDIPEIDFAWVQASVAQHPLPSVSEASTISDGSSIDHDRDDKEDNEVDPLMKELEALCAKGTPAPLQGEGMLIPIVPFDGQSTVNIDADMHEIFAEELQEEIISLEEWLPNFTPYMNDPDLLRNVRKSFHTIKGSGRMVGTKTLSEISWRIEAVLNTVVEGRQPLTANIVCLVHTGKHIFNEFKNVLQGAHSYWNPELFYVWSDALLDGRDMASPFVTQKIPVTQSAESAPLLDVEELEPTGLVLAPVDHDLHPSHVPEITIHPQLSLGDQDDVSLLSTSEDLIKKAHLSPEHVSLISHGMLDTVHDTPLEDHADFSLHQVTLPQDQEVVEDLDSLWKASRPEPSHDVDLTPSFVAPTITPTARPDSAPIPDMELSLLSTEDERFDVPTSKAPVIPEHLDRALSQWNLENNDEEAAPAPAWTKAPVVDRSTRTPEPTPMPAPQVPEIVPAPMPPPVPVVPVKEEPKVVPAPPVQPVEPSPVKTAPVSSVEQSPVEQPSGASALPQLPSYNQAATDWKVHLHHLYDLNALMYQTSQGWDGSRPEELKAWLEDLWQHQQWSINYLRDTCLDNEKKMRDSFKEKEARLSSMIQQSQALAPSRSSVPDAPKDRPRSSAPVFEPPTLTASSDDDTYISTDHVETLSQTQAMTSPPLIPSPRPRKTKNWWQKIGEALGLNSGKKKSK